MMKFLSDFNIGRPSGIRCENKALDDASPQPEQAELLMKAPVLG
jgi:hypothetical protein